MTGIKRRIKALEEKAGVGGEITVRICERIIGEDGEVASTSEKIITMRSGD